MACVVQLDLWLGHGGRWLAYIYIAHLAESDPAIYITDYEVGKGAGVCT